MKIGLVVQGGFDRGGRERVIPALLWLVERLSRRHDVHVFVLDYYPEPCSYPLLGATIHDLGRVAAPRGLRRPQIGRRLAAALARIGPFDLLHAYGGMPAGVVTTRLARRLGVACVLTLDSGELVAIDDIAYGLRRRFVDRRAMARAIRDAAAVTVCTAFMARFLAGHNAHPHIIPLGVDAARFPAVDRPDGPPWRLLRVGSLNRVKDYPTLLEAMKTVAARLPDVHLDIVGEDTLGGEIQMLTGRLQLRDHVTFHGFQPTDLLAAFYSRADLNLVSSRHEAANVTVLEAACTGLPTVGTRVGYVDDWHPDRAVGVPTRDPAALGEAIVALLGDTTARRRLGVAARAWALEHDADRTATAFERLYSDLTQRR